MRTRTIIATAAMALLVDLAATAVQAAEEPRSDAEIVVEAPRTVAPPSPPSPSQRSAFTGAPVVTTTLKIPALYGDLNLARPDHAARLMIRIDRVAHDACGYLDRLLPLSSDPACMGRAVDLAMPAAKAAVAAAQR